MKTLLSKTLSQFLLCTITIFVLTTPLFYLLTKHFYAEDMIDIIEAVKLGNEIPPLDLEADLMIGVMVQFILISLVLSVALLITIHFITHKLWLPFDDTLSKAEKFNLAQSEIPQLGDTNITEFFRLNQSLLKLMKRDKEIYCIQKEFTENASHELQTPLAIICSKLDLLMQENLNKRQMQLVSDLYILTTRMGYLNRNLLLLAKIENAQYTDMQDVNIANLLSDTLPAYRVLLKGVSLHFDDCRSNVNTLICANITLLECLLKNLIVNAIRYSSPAGNVEIVLNADGFTIDNTSDGRGALDTNKLFQRFRSVNVPNKGNGLGLAIVKAICDFHKWTVSYSFKDNRHSFIVSFYKKQ